MESLGILAALGAALAWGSYAVPFKKSKSERLLQFQVLIGVGVLISALIFSLILGYPLSLNIYGLISGVLWAIANAILLPAIINLGISKAVPIVSSLVILSTFLWGVLVFNEIPQGLLMGFLGIGLIIPGVILVSTAVNTQSKSVKKGLILAILSGLIFGSQLAPLKIGNLTTKEFFFPVCLGIFITAIMIALIKKVKFKKEAIKEGLLCGVLWNIGNLLSVISISLIGLSKAMPISQSSSLVAVLWGLFYFKEITKRKLMVQILIGAIILLTGIAILSLA